MKKEKINILVFTQSTPLDLVVNSIKFTKNLFNFLLLSTHKLFETERREIQNNVNKTIAFKTFADFLTDEEMARCDTTAYEEISKNYNNDLGTALIGGCKEKFFWPTTLV